MKEWLTPLEIADAGLADMPSTKRGVSMLAEREGWNEHPVYARKRAGRGGGMEYSYRILPSLAQIQWTQRYMVVGAPEEPTGAIDAGDEEEDQLSGRAQRERDAKLAIVAAFENWSRGQPLRFMARVHLFTLKYCMGTLAVEPWLKEAKPHFGERSLIRWYTTKKAGRTANLAVDRGAARKGTGTLDTANEGKVRAFVLALLAQNAHLSALHIRDVCRDEFGDTIMTRGGSKPMPPVRAFQRLIATLKSEHQVELTKLRNPDLYRSTMAPSGTGTFRHVTEPSTFWMIDASPVDALCIDGRYTIYVCIDVASRDKVLLLSRTPRASAVGLLLRKSILMLGISTAGLSIKTDNGSDFAAIATKRLCTALGIELQFSDAYSPEQKGHVERAIRTFQHDMATTLPGYVGHSVADRTEIENRRSFAKRRQETEHETFEVSLTGPELQAYVDRWVETERHRSRDALKGRSPFQMTVAARTPIRKIDERALDVLLMPVAGKDGQRTVTKFGIRIDGRHYGTPSILPGAQVFVRMDPLDMGRVYAFTPDGAQFLGEGVCPELAGIDPAKYYAELRAAQAELIEGTNRQVKADMKAIAKGPAIIERVLRVRERDLPNVIAMPRRREDQSTPQIDAAIEAASDTPAAAAVAPATPPQSVPAEAPLATNVRKLRAEETPHQRFARALDVDRRMKAGEPVDAAEAHWLGSYQLQSEYRSLMDFYEQSGGLMSL